MPKKTKKEKILSEQRRKNLYTLNFKPIAKVEIKTPNNGNEFSLVRRDLTKTIILGMLAIGFEFVLYWFSQIRP